MVYKIIDAFILGVTGMFMIGMLFKIPETILNEFKNIKYKNKLSISFFIIGKMFL